MNSTNSREQGYTGHNPVGGLQTHSTGDRYPWTIAAKGIVVEYYAYNTVTEQRGPLRATAREAGEDADYYRTQRDTATAVQRGLHTWLDVFYNVGIRRPA